MRATCVILMSLLVALFFLFCKDDDGGVGPGDGDNTEFNAFKMNFYAVVEEQPSFVNIMFEIVDATGAGVNNMTVDRIVLTEDGMGVDPIESAMNLRKKSEINYKFVTVLMLDVSAGMDMSALKAGATQFINSMDPAQSVAVYKFADQNPELVVDFTKDQTTLINAINALEAGPETTNLYGSVVKGLALWSEEYTPTSVTQGQMVLMTDGEDTKGAYQLNHAEALASERDVYTIGYGGGAAADALKRIGSRGYYQASDAEQLKAKFAEVQSDILKNAESFYWLNYLSAKRGSREHTFKVSIQGNLLQTEDSYIDGTFNSQSFIDTKAGLFVNWSSGVPTGVDTAYVTVDSTNEIRALSTGGTNVPYFTWSSSDPSIVTVEPFGEGEPLALLTAKGADGDEVVITVKDDANGYEKAVRILVLHYHFGNILREWWVNIEGTAISSLTGHANYPDNPTGRELLRTFEGPTDILDNYGARYRGYLHPTKGGKYKFWIASDDYSDLLLSTDENPENATRTCYVAGYTGSREWTKYSQQASALIDLRAGQAYYIEVLMKEGTGGDNLAVAWQMEGGQREIIDGKFLSPWILR